MQQQEQQQQQLRLRQQQQRQRRLRRNMLMNIVLRPGGGDRARALPKPRVDVRSDGANAIIIRLTFPEDENIQGLRAFAPGQQQQQQQQQNLVSLRESIIEFLVCFSIW